MIFERLFAKSGTFPSYTMYSPFHLVLLVLCAVFIGIALFFSRKMDKAAVAKTLRRCTILLWAFEITKIIFNLCIGNANNPNTYIPLYFCSITLYCGIFASVGKGRLKRLGEVFLVVGGIVGGIAYLVSPSTTAGIYPAFHFITIQSYIHHSIMVYLGILFVVTDYVELKMKDIVYYAATVILMSVIAYIVNSFLGSNLMFVSENHPGTAVELVYNVSPTLFPVHITLWQAIPPFIVIYALEKFYKRMIKR